MNTKILFSIFFIFIAVSCFAQKTEVIGKVVRSCDKKPLSGVSVWVENGGASTTTDYEGNFTISVDKKDILNFTKFAYEGKTSEIVNNKIDISLDLDDREIDGIEDLLNDMNNMINRLREENSRLGRPKPCPTCPPCPDSKSE